MTEQTKTCKCGKKHVARGHVVSILGYREIAASTLALRLERPSGFSFEAGQNIDLGLTIEDAHDKFGGKRTLSIASAPYEDYLEVAVRLRPSPYKEALANAKPGDLLTIEGPYGSFRHHGDPSVPTVFLAGGIGITPCLSIIRQMVHDSWTGKVCLLYSNRTPTSSCYLSELQSLAHANSSLTVIATFTQLGDEPNRHSDRRGRINAAMIRECVTDLRKARFYAVGETRMVWTMLAELDRMVDRSQVTVEDFTGF